MTIHVSPSVAIIHHILPIAPVCIMAVPLTAVSAAAARPIIIGHIGQTPRIIEAIEAAMATALIVQSTARLLSPHSVARTPLFMASALRIRAFGRAAFGSARSRLFGGTGCIVSSSPHHQHRRDAAGEQHDNEQ
jgi:hypothetical protein